MEPGKNHEGQPATAFGDGEDPGQGRHVNPAATVPPSPAAGSSAEVLSPGPASGGAAAAPAKGRGWIVGLAAVIVAGAVCLFGIQSCTDSLGSLSLFETSGSSLTKADQASVGVIELSSTIAYDGTACSPEGFSKLLDQAAEDDNIKAVVIRIDSGGGTATAGEEMTTYLKEFKQETGKPVVVSCASMCASAAYEIASQADYIYAAKSSAVGAIGTIMQVVNYADLMEKLGIKIDNIKSAESKDSSYGTRELTEEERKHYQHQVDQITQNFVEAVAEGRGMTTDQVSKLATGMTFTGTDSVENGLVDAIGTLRDAVDKAAELAGCEDLEEVNLQQSADDWSSLVDLLGLSKVDREDVIAALKELSNEQAVQ